MRSNARTGLSLLYEMAGRHDLPLARWKAIEDLFVPERPRGLFTILFGVTWGRGRAPRFKIYLNPRVHGLSAMHAVIQEAMARLGFRRGWDAA